MSSTDDKDKLGLCFRCEHRAKFLEAGRRPRCECGEINETKWACYMYRPVKPVVLAPLDAADDRPQFGPSLISSRSKFVRVADELEYFVRQAEGGSVILCVTAEIMREIIKTEGPPS